MSDGSALSIIDPFIGTTVVRAEINSKAIDVRGRPFVKSNELVLGEGREAVLEVWLAGANGV